MEAGHPGNKNFQKNRPSTRRQILLSSLNFQKTPLALKKNKNLKLYYSISEVASMIGVTESTLRFWEKEFPSIKPQKAGRNIRQYTKEDIDEIRKVHHLLKEKGMKVEGARQVLLQNGKGQDVRIDMLQRLKFIRDELMEISKELSDMT